MSFWARFSRFIVAAALLTSFGAANAQVTDIFSSPHNLSTTGPSPVAGVTTAEVCVFCHTPHGADTQASVPLWNKDLPDPALYTRYSSLETSTLDGGETAVGSVSLACLSCHDGAQAVDAVLNTPGSGMGANYPLGTNLGNGVQMAGTPVPNLERDLTNDHPISIQYAGGGIDSVNHTDGTTAPPALMVDPDFNAPRKDTINGNPAWWVDSPAGVGTANTRDKTDMILYTRTDGTAGRPGINQTANPQPFVECGSCHDPHNNTTFVAGESVNFLRMPNTGSQICTTCHVK